MDVTVMLDDNRLANGFPLPRDAPFTTRTAIAEGVGPSALTALVAAGVLVRPVKGVYVAAEVPDSPRLRADCLRLVVPEDCVVVDRHAGWLLGAEMILAPGEHLGLQPLSLFRPAGMGRLRNDLCASGERNLTPYDVVEVNGVRVTTPLRTAVDLGRVRLPSVAVTGMSMMLRHGGFTKAELRAELPRFRGMRWITTARGVLPVVDARFESPPEAVLALRCHEVGLAVVPQLRVERDGIVIARLDLGSERLRIGVEYDGEEWHSTPAQLEHDRVRRSAAADEGYWVEAFRRGAVFGQGRDVDTRLMALKVAAEQRLRRAG